MASPSIGTTDNHPFWSEDRREYVPAGELRVGENLRTVNGSRTYVQSIRPRGPPEDVYNLEVEGAHTYHVGTTGVLVHNNCSTTLYHGTDSDSALRLLNGGGLDAAEAAARKIDGPKGFFLATDLDDAWYFGNRRKNGTILEFRLSEKATKSLSNAGALLRPIAAGRIFRAKGKELHVTEAMYDLFNRLLKSGDITVVPANF